jgi:hypothetical protein
MEFGIIAEPTSYIITVQISLPTCGRYESKYGIWHDSLALGSVADTISSLRRDILTKIALSL